MKPTPKEFASGVCHDTLPRLISFSFELRMKLLVTLLALISSGVAAADCPKAADWARAFYSEHYSFHADPSDRVLQLTTPEFGALLKREWEYSNGEIGHLDYDPWLGGQDGEIGKPVRFSVERSRRIRQLSPCHIRSCLAPSTRPNGTRALGIAQARTRVLAASRFHHSARRLAVICVLTSAALTNRSSRRLPAARSAFLLLQPF